MYFIIKEILISIEKMTFDFKCTVLLLVMLMYSSECALRQNLVPSKKDISTKDKLELKIK